MVWRQGQRQGSPREVRRRIQIRSQRLTPNQWKYIEFCPDAPWHFPVLPCTFLGFPCSLDSWASLALPGLPWASLGLPGPRSAILGFLRLPWPWASLSQAHSLPPGRLNGGRKTFRSFLKVPEVQRVCPSQWKYINIYIYISSVSLALRRLSWVP